MTVVDWRQHGLVRRCERVDTAHMVMIAEAYSRLVGAFTEDQIAELLAVPVQGGVSPVDRLAEAVRVYDWWPPAALQYAVSGQAAWNSLAEPPRWGDVHRDDVIGYVRGYARRTKRWPLIDELRRQFGRNPTNRAVGAIAGQATLEVGS